MPDIRLLTPADRPALERFLADHAPQAMFLRANLARSGLDDGDRPYRGRYAAAFDGEAITGVAAHYWNGMLILLAPQHAARLALVAAGGRRLTGLLGPQADIAAARAALDVDSGELRVDDRENLFGLTLARMSVPALLRDGRAACRLAVKSDLPLLTDWRLDFDIERNGATRSPRSLQAAQDAAAHWIEEQGQYILEVGGKPVAGCCFNARLPDMVQIGNVWTPPQLRGSGYGRAVIAGALQHAATAGVRQAILFTGEDNAPAQRAYLGLGFTRIGDYAIVLLAD